ncbi:hypothetical protein IGI39_003980 [Enterococcus sp. AZ135]|uniref:GNAT family acetyltransferase n=1 Tax=unclassified Enterococcus TaxID=2608891 RepID=UPI003F269C01
MTLVNVSLCELIESTSKEDAKKLLLTFSSKSKDVESFLHSKAIQFEDAGISRTYLVFYTQDDSETVPFFAGYFSIANKSLNVTKKNFEKLSNSQKRTLLGSGHRTNKNNYSASSMLLGQLGKNYTNHEDLKITGRDILAIAYGTIKQVYRMLGGKILWLECEDIPKVRKFYEKNGFSLLNGFQSEAGLLVYIKKLSQI